MLELAGGPPPLGTAASVIRQTRQTRQTHEEPNEEPRDTAASATRQTHDVAVTVHAAIDGAARSDTTKKFEQAVHELETQLGSIPEPASLHEGTAYVCLGAHPIARGPTVLFGYRAIFVLASFALLFGQVFAASSLMRNIDNVGKKCDESSNCRYGFFCSSSTGNCDPCKWPATPNKQRAAFDFCGADGALAWADFYAGLAGGYTRDEDERVAQCSGCYTSTERYLQSWAAPQLYYQSMGWMDHLMLVMATIVVAFGFMDEMRDIKSVTFRVRDTPSGASASGGSGGVGWKVVMLVHTAVRQLVFLPILVSSIPLFILRMGSDALSICLNTVAVLFLLDIDNQVRQANVSHAISTFHSPLSSPHCYRIVCACVCVRVCVCARVRVCVWGGAPGLQAHATDARARALSSSAASEAAARRRHRAQHVQLPLLRGRLRLRVRSAARVWKRHGHGQAWRLVMSTCRPHAG